MTHLIFPGSTSFLIFIKFSIKKKNIQFCLIYENILRTENNFVSLIFIGWEPREENEPLVNHDLLAALATLTPGESHEILAQTENKPGIYIHAAPPPGGQKVVPDVPESPQKIPIVHTRCPERI